MIAVLVLLLSSAFCTGYSRFFRENAPVWKTNTISPQCQNSLDLFVMNLNATNEDNTWALRMLDASSKIPVGLLYYNFGELGNFKECVEIESATDHVAGKYCLGNIEVNSTAIDDQSVFIKNHMFMKILLTKLAGGVKTKGNPTLAICIPDNCTEGDAKQLMSNPQLGIDVQSVMCQTAGNVYPELTTEAVAGLSVLSVIIVVVMISTIFDLFYTKKSATVHHQLLLAFSLYTNGKKVFETSRRPSNLSCLDGIKVISMFWIIILHTYSVYSSGPVSNAIDIVNFTDSLISMVFINGDLACDTFLLVGGLLVTYVFFKRKNDVDMSVASIFKHYIHRYIRLTPALAGVVLVSATLLRYLGSGPKWPYIVNSFEGFCKTYWWSAILYIQNELNVDKMCVGHSWYLNIDMQLYIFSPLIFWLLRNRVRTGIVILIFTILLSMAVSFIRAFDNELSGVKSTYYQKSSSDAYMNTYYLKTETRAAPWLIGVILGYFLTKKELMEAKLSKKIVIAMWLLSATVLLTCVLGGHSTLRRPEYFKLQNSFYITLVRPAFVLAVAWIIWACATNRGGLVNALLSLPIFQFLNKFIYSMYLVHVTALYMIVFAYKTPIYFNVFNLAYWFWGIFMCSFGLSIIWVLIFESPMIAIEKILLG
ncbi:unnamed protein product [Phyllotreta striolata]|uniref:Nose resistant-to-fluoxetine protein N-terminal domain-containing protein n=1 Tax=Phyllotreta striolata TaxID=444603 RepID=A0A9N9TLR0_PHYSR|nr:unnamed protein product [Phyllotreta striolata]